MVAMNDHLPEIILKYGNKHTIDTFKERTAYVPTENSDDDASEEETSAPFQSALAASKVNNLKDGTSSSNSTKNGGT